MSVWGLINDAEDIITDCAIDLEEGRKEAALLKAVEAQIYLNKFITLLRKEIKEGAK